MTKPTRSAALLSAVVVLSCAALAPTNAHAQSSPQTWSRLSPAHIPGGREDAAMAYDGATHQLILFGGQVFGSSPSGFTELGDTWLWTGSDWQQLSPATSPAPRSLAQMAYDEASGQLILFGGSNGGFANNSELGDTWAWTGTTWTQLSPATSPIARQNGSMVYDPGTQQLVLFGGTSSLGFMYDTWAWNGTTWVQQPDAGNTPGPRTAFGFALDPQGNAPILFGGIGAATPFANDTWHWAPLWTPFTPPVGVSPPPQRANPSMAYDPATGQVILFGGLAFQVFNDTWAWNGGPWVQESPIESPPARSDAPLAYDAATNQLLLFGGLSSNGQNFLDDTWVWTAPPTGRASSAAPTPTAESRASTSLTAAPVASPLTEMPTFAG